MKASGFVKDFLARLPLKSSWRPAKSSLKAACRNFLPDFFQRPSLHACIKSVLQRLPLQASLRDFLERHYLKAPLPTSSKGLLCKLPASIKDFSLWDSLKTSFKPCLKSSVEGFLQRLQASPKTSFTSCLQAISSQSVPRPRERGFELY